MNGTSRAAWFETALSRLLTMRVDGSAFDERANCCDKLLPELQEQ